MTYVGERGYQPVINYWAEQDLILADEFRDGNVPAGMDCLSSFLRATRALPQSVETIYFRSDSAAYQHKLLDKMREGVEHNGKQVPVYQRRCERGAQRQNHFSIGVGVEAVEETYREGADRREKRVGGTRVYSLGFIGEKGHEAGSVFSDPGAALADRAVF